MYPNSAIPQLLVVEPGRVTEVVSREEHAASLLVSNLPSFTRRYVQLGERCYQAVLLLVEKPGGWMDKRYQQQYLWRVFSEQKVRDTEVFVSVRRTNRRAAQFNLQGETKRSMGMARDSKKKSTVDVKAELDASESIGGQVNLLTGDVPITVGLVFVVTRQTPAALERRAASLNQCSTILPTSAGRRTHLGPSGFRLPML